MYVVNCIECSGLKLCWYGAGIYLLMVGRIRDSKTFAAGQRSEMGRYENPWERSLSGFDIGMINDVFHIAVS